VFSTNAYELMITGYTPEYPGSPSGRSDTCGDFVGVDRPQNAIEMHCDNPMLSRYVVLQFPAGQRLKITELEVCAEGRLYE